MHGWVRCENDLQREVNFFRKNSARPEDRRRAHHRYTRGEGAGCVHNLGYYRISVLTHRTLNHNQFHDLGVKLSLEMVGHKMQPPYVLAVVYKIADRFRGKLRLLSYLRECGVYD